LHNAPVKSKVIESIIGQSCMLYLDSSLSCFNAVILDVDEYWLNFLYTDKKKGKLEKIVKLSRVYEISDIKTEL
jgi:hypothetical protein